MRASTAFLLNALAVLLVALAFYTALWALHSFVSWRLVGYLTTPGGRTVFLVILIWLTWAMCEEPFFPEEEGLERHREGGHD